jgi:hypothetical protein
MKTINMTPVSSSQIAAVGHDAETKTLRIQFVKGNATYDYANVTTELHKSMMDAPSVGSFFSNNIKNNPTLFPFSKAA